MASQRSRPQIWQRSYFPPQGGGKGGGGTTYNSQTTQIPPEVLARYNAVNQRAENVAQQPFQAYGGEFVAPVNQTQTGGIANIANAAGTVDPYFNSATGSLNQGLAAAQPYYGTATGQVADAATSGTALNNQALGTLNQGLGAAQPFNTSAGNAYGNAYTGAQPYQTGATGLAMAGTQSIDPSQLNIAGMMSPYNEAVVQSTLGLVDQQQGRDLRSQRDQQIMSGGFGGDGANIGRSVLQGQQDLARANVASNLYNQNYSQALGAAQQQQGVGLGAAQANRAALQTGAGQLANIGQQGFQQGMGYGQAQQGLGQQIFGQGAAASQGQAAIGNQQFQQGLGAANANQALGQGQFAMGNTAAGTYAGLGTGLQGAQLQQGQAQIGAGTIQQQTQQAQDQAVYNQFLQQQGYPFQVAQFLANIAMGTGALSGSTTSGYSAAPQPFFSDERLKEDIRTIGHTKDGLRIVSYKYKGSPTTQIGMLAQDVEKKRPHAVGLAGGYKTVDYDAATRKALGGAVANDNAGVGYAGGGMPGLDQAGLAQLLLAHQAMYPGAAHDRAGITAGTGPRGMQLIKPPSGSIPAPKPPAPQPAPTSTMQQGLGAVAGAVNAGKGISDLYKTGKSAVGEARDLYRGARDLVVDQKYGSTDKQIEDWSKYGSKPSEGLGAAAPAPAVAAADPVGNASSNTLAGGAGADTLASAAAEAPVDVAAALPVDDLLEQGLLLAQRGGRIKRFAAGGMPYGGSEGYLPDELYEPMDAASLAKKQKEMEPDKGPGATASKAGSGGKGLGSAVGSIAGMGLGSLFGMPGLGAMVGGGLGGLFNKGGRAGYDDGGSVAFADPGVDPAWAPDTSLEGVKLKPVPDNVLPFTPRGLALPMRPEVAGPPEPAGPPAPTGLAPTPAPANTEPLGPPAPPVRAQPPTGVAPAPAPMPAPQPVAQSPDNDFDAPDKVMHRMWTKESGHNQFKPDGTPLLSSAGAAGYTQMHTAGPEAAALAGVPYDKNRVATDAEYNKLLGTTWARHLQQKYGDPYKAAAAYNAGEGALGNAIKMAAVKGGSYIDYMLPETQDYVHYVSGGKFGKPAGGGQVDRALALAPGSGTPTAGGPAPTPTQTATGLTGPLDMSLPGKDNPKGDWLDRNEKYVVSGLTFLGNMLASPSHQLLGSIGSGLAAAAPAYASFGMKEREAQQAQQGIQLGARRTDISSAAQLQQVWTDLNARIGALKGLVPQATIDALQRQADLVRQQIMTLNGVPAAGGGTGAGADAMRVATGVLGGPGAPPTSGATTGSAPPAPPAGSPPPTPPVTTQATPPGNAPTAPANTAASPPLDWWPAEKPRPWVPTDAQVNIADYEAKMDPMQNPRHLRALANDVAINDPALKQRYLDQARAAEDRLRSGEYINRDGQVERTPGYAAAQQSKANIADNANYNREAGAQRAARQQELQRYQELQQLLQTYESGAFAGQANEFFKALKRVGISPPENLDPSDADAIIKNALDVSFGALQKTGGAPSDARFEGAQHVQPGISQDPKANRLILATRLAGIEQSNRMYEDYLKEQQAHPGLNRQVFEHAWMNAHPLQDDVKRHEKEVALRGATPTTRMNVDGRSATVPDPTKLEMNQRYVVDAIPGDARFGGKKSLILRFVGLDDNGAPRWSTK